VTKDGKRIVGAQRSYDDFSAQLMDASDDLLPVFRPR